MDKWFIRGNQAPCILSQDKWCIRDKGCHLAQCFLNKDRCIKDLYQQGCAYHKDMHHHHHSNNQGP